MDRFWLLTSTFYGNWLPGDVRGFVSRVRDVRVEDLQTATRHVHHEPGTPCDAAFQGLHQSASEQLLADPVRLSQDQARVIATQFHQTAEFRGWCIFAIAILSNHVHLVVGVPGDPDPTRILGDLKAYGSRALNSTWGKPQSGTWWTSNGSKRKLPNAAAVRSAMAYVRNQHDPLYVWVAPDFSEEKT